MTDNSSLKAILGPTNTGKTFFAIERMLAHRSGMIGLPLRLLAREVYSRVATRVGADAVALVTGEERIVPPKARYWVCTVEAMPLDVPVECLAVDEIQVATDFDRGHVFTNRILNARGISETLLLGAATMAPLIRTLLPHAEIIHRPRFSSLLYAGSRKISRQPARSAIVAFSAREVYAIAELIRRERGGAAVVMGALSPRTRNAQVDMYQNGDVDFLVATDAIGMGLNLDVHHVAFADDRKFDGHQTRPLTPAEFGQIAGRAGRHMHNGTFGVTGNADPFEQELVVALEGHDFEPVRQIQWRNDKLDFASLESLRASLEVSPDIKALTRVPIATDQQALEFLARNEAGELAVGRANVELMWQCCALPDYRDISPAQHGEIITRIYTDLRRHGAIATDWIAEQVRFCDNAVGDIDTLSNRIRQIRTWTYVANRKNWLEDPAHWREKTRDIEDRLSDALHERLTQRFVDRRTSVLMRHLRDRSMATPEINDRGEISLEVTPQIKALTRVPIATDQQALEFLARNEAGELAIGRANVELMWQCCALPDYRDISPAQHGEIITRIYTDLRRHGAIATDWIAEQVRFCDNAVGDIDTLSNRIRQIRTWTYVANRKNWLEDPAHWREKTRDIEDRLSDALHERLTQRFVDRRTSVLMRHLRDRSMATPEINDRGEISLEGHLIGSIQGFRFTLARSDGDTDAKALGSAAAQVIAPEIARRADRLAGAPNEEFVLSTDGTLRWRGEVVASLAEGDALYAPRLIVLADESLSGPDLERVQDRMNLWLRHHVNTVLEPVLALEAPADLEGPARGVAYRLYENLGLLPRQAVSDEVKGLDQDVRAKLRKLGVKFGAYHIYVPLALKPAPRELALILYALKNGGIRQPGVSELPHTVLSGRTSFQVDPEISVKLYEVAGFKVAGKRAVRVDILERLADIIRPLIALDAKTHPGDAPAGAAEGNGFRVTVEMTSLLGTAGDDFNSILTSLGYRVRRTPKVAPPVEITPPVETEAQIDAVVDATLGTEAVATVEGTEATVATPLAEAAAVEAATADLGAPAPEAAPPSEAAAPAEPEFDDVWFPGGRRPDTPRHQNTRRPPRADAAPGEAPAEGARPPRRFNRDNRNNGATPAADGAKPEGQAQPPRPRFDNTKPRRNFGDDKKPFDGGGKKFAGKRDSGRDDWKEHKPREKREVALDPDSPWAALAALRNPKPE